ncbi:MAG: hypothetical protein QM770_23055 [Tepidisphaeraceae bacterium]
MSIAIEQPPPAKRSRRFQMIAVALTFVVAVLVVVFWKDIERLPRMFIPRNFGVVEPGRIYRAGLLDRALAVDTMKQHGIKSVICLTYDPGKPDFDALPEEAKEAGADLLICKGLDGRGEGDVQQYVLAIERLKQSYDAGKPVLIHCAAVRSAPARRWSTSAPSSKAGTPSAPKPNCSASATTRRTRRTPT